MTIFDTIRYPITNLYEGLDALPDDLFLLWLSKCTTDEHYKSIAKNGLNTPIGNMSREGCIRSAIIYKTLELQMSGKDRSGFGAISELFEFEFLDKLKKTIVEYEPCEKK